MGEMLTRLIENIAAGKEAGKGAEQQLIKLGVAKLPEIEKDNTDRNRTSPFAFTGNKFEFRAVGSSQSIAFPVTLLHAAVAEAIGELTEQLRETLRRTKNVNDAVLKVVKESFKETSAVRFEGNNYSNEWVEEAHKRGLLNLRRTPEALAQLTTKNSRAVLTKLGILTKAEIDSRYHVKMERYVKDMLIELHTMGQIVDTMILPACYSYHGMLADAASKAKAAGITSIPQVAAANEVGNLIEQLRERRAAMSKVVEKADHMHEEIEACGKLLTADGADAMAAVRESCDALELLVGDEFWPLPKYREILFPV
jgi:glutamine synthetase